MDEGTKFGLRILGWIISSTFYIISLYYIVFKLQQENLFVLALSIWMIISGAGLLYALYLTGKDYNGSPNTGRTP